MTLPAALLSGMGVLVLAGGGCGEADIPSRADSSSIPAGDRAVMPLPMEGVHVKLVVPDTVAPGQLVPMTLRLTNPTDAARDLYLRGRDVTFDIVVRDSAGNEVWRRLPADPIPAILQLRTLGPGETLELRHDWNQVSRHGLRAPDGAYSVRAEVLTDGSSSLISNDARLVIRSSAGG